LPIGYNNATGQVLRGINDFTRDDGTPFEG